MSIDRWKVPKGPGTHLLMNGGILQVPFEETQEFYREYIACVSSGVKLFVVEQKTERFKFFVDLDYKAPDKLNDDDLIQFCSIIHSSLSGRCMIARARVRSVDNGLIKSGVHIHWPDMIVTRTEALNLRTRIIANLAESFPFDWNSIIDASVYTGSGLRMLWSHKRPTGDPYTPWKMLNGTVFSKDPSAETLELFAVRVSETDATNISPSLENSSHIERYIQRYIEGQSNAQVRRVQRHEHNGWYVQTDSTYCENIHRRHKSNHVWFHIASKRISQRCFDEECREFKGCEHILPPSIVEQLNEVSIVGSPSRGFHMDIFSDGPSSTVQKVQTHGSSVLGTGPGELEEIFRKPGYVRKAGFESP